MPVIRGLDLDDPLAAGEAARDPHSVQCRLGAAVGETPLRLREAPRQLARHDEVVGHRLGEMRSEADARLDCLDDERVSVAHDHDAEAVVEVDVLVAVDIPHPAPRAALDEYGLRRRVLEGARHAARYVLGRLFPHLVRACAPAAEFRLLALAQAAHQRGRGGRPDGAAPRNRAVRRISTRHGPQLPGCVGVGAAGGAAGAGWYATPGTATSGTMARPTRSVYATVLARKNPVRLKATASASSGMPIATVTRIGRPVAQSAAADSGSGPTCHPTDAGTTTRSAIQKRNTPPAKGSRPANTNMLRLLGSNFRQAQAPAMTVMPN